MATGEPMTLLVTPLGAVPGRVDASTFIARQLVLPPMARLNVELQCDNGKRSSAGTGPCPCWNRRLAMEASFFSVVHAFSQMQGPARPSRADNCKTYWAAGYRSSLS